MEQKLFELTKENNLLRSRLKQQQQQQQQERQQQQQLEQQTLRLVAPATHDTVIVSTAQRKETISTVIPTVPSLPVSSVTTLAANLANVIGQPSKLPTMFPTHLFAAAATPLLAAPPGSVPPAPSIFQQSGTASTSLLTPVNANAASQINASAVQQFPALQICTLQAALQQVQQAGTLR